MILFKIIINRIKNSKEKIIQIKEKKNFTLKNKIYN